MISECYDKGEGGGDNAQGLISSRPISLNQLMLDILRIIIGTL